MNCIGLIKDSTDLSLRVSLSDRIFLFFISDTIVVSDTVESMFNFSALVNSFDGVDEAKLKHSYAALKGHGFIKEDKEGAVIVGEIVNKRPRLFINQSSKIDLSPDFKTAEKLLLTYGKMARGLAEAEYKRCKSSFEQLRGKNLDTWEFINVYVLYKTLYQIVRQEAPRDLTQKECGLLGHAMKQFSIPIVAKMLFHYFLNLNRYAKSGGTSVSTFYFLRDRLRDDLVVSKPVVRDESDEDTV